jgi:hypothetical protein
MTELKDFTEEQLQAEIDRRRASTAPRLIENPDYERLRSSCQDYVNDVATNRFYDATEKARYIFQDVMCTLFGNHYFDWEHGMMYHNDQEVKK